MITFRQYRCIHIFVLIFFTIFIFDNACFAKEKYPRYAKINIKLDIGLKVKRVNKKVVPLAIKIKNRTFKIVKKHGKYGINIKARDLAQLSPEFKEKLATSISVLSLYRVQQLVKKDKKKAQEVIDLHHELNASRADPLGSKPVANFFQKLPANLVSFFTGEAWASDNAMTLAATGAAVDKQFMGQMNKNYNKILNSQSFAYPTVQPGIGGWDLLNDAERQNQDSDNQGQNATHGEEEEEESWYDKVLGAFFGIVILIAPIAAIVFLCTNPLTIASVLMSLAIANGAVTGTAIITTFLGSIGDLLSGKPLLEITDVVQWGPNPDQIIDNSYEWP